MQHKINYFLRFSIVYLLMIFSAGVTAGGFFSDDLGFGGQTKKFLTPDEAFILSATGDDSGAVKLNFRIADGYYLYKDKIQITPQDESVSVDSLSAPLGDIKEDPLFGKVEVYHHDTDIPASLTHGLKTGQELTFEVAYQGCAEDGICYPPLKKSISVILAAAAAEPADETEQVSNVRSLTPLADQNVSEQETALSESDGIANILANKPLLISLGLFFLFGLALSLTPCILPMIPILSGIIVEQSENITTRKSFMISLFYVLGMALTYAVIGMVAGTFGHNMQAVFQNPWIIASFAAVFVALAISMFGFYEIQIPSAVQVHLHKMSNKQQSGTFSGALLMGIFSAIIVGPCVAPPLAGALIFIGQTGDAVLGGLALFVMGLGMGVPLLLLGASAGKLIPRAGGWMEVVKHIFGVLMLGVAIWLLERIIPAPLSLALWGILLIGSGVYSGAFETETEQSSGWHHFRKAFGIIIIIYGTLLIVGAASGGDNVFRPLSNLSGKAVVESHQQELSFKKIKGLNGLEKALDVAHANNKQVMLDFYADWCIECKRMIKNTFTDSQVQQQLANVILLKADVTPNDADDQALLRSLDLLGPPAIIFYDLDSNEKRNMRITGYVGPADFQKHLKRALN